MKGLANNPVLVFDLGRVLINFDPDIIINRLLPYTNWSRDDMYSLFAGAEFIDKFEKGKMSEDEFFDVLVNVLSLKDVPRDALKEIWNDMFFPNNEMLSLVHMIRDNTDIENASLSETVVMEADITFKWRSLSNPSSFKTSFVISS